MVGSFRAVGLGSMLASGGLPDFGPYAAEVESGFITALATALVKAVADVNASYTEEMPLLGRKGKA